MAIQIDNRQTNHPIETQKIQLKTQVILNALGCPEDELSIVLVDDDQITVINMEYLNHQGPTNVISFSMREGDCGDINPQLIGDVVISMDTCAREAQSAEMPMDLRFDQLLIHGILHLFGYDHTQNESQALIMEQKSLELIKLIYQVD